MNPTSLFNRVSLLLVILLSQALTGQQSSRGRDFYLSFLPNYHETQSATTDSLYIYIVAQVPTSGTIELTTRSGKSRTISFTISNPQNIYSISLAWQDYELLGYNSPYLSDAFTGTRELEKASTQMIAVHADQDVAVYALSKALKTSDATLVFPTTCLGLDYRILSFKSDGRTQRNAPTDQYTPSEFCVVATENNTQLTISTTCPTTSGARSLSVNLRRGQSYLVQAQFSTQNLNYDLSGSTVSATKPVAVFSGHQRAWIPLSGAMTSRDCLYEQMLPVSVWGTKYVLTPLAQPLYGTTQGNDLYRVLAAEDNTVLELNGKVLVTLSKNTFFESNLTQAGLLNASKPVLVALYKKSASVGGNDDGDPFMMVIPPRRQYLSSYRFTNVQVASVYHQQYVTLIVSTNDVASLQLDGAPLKATFTAVGSSCYSYASIAMKDGAHEISCASPFGLYVYGYGNADSYGYVGGMAFYPDSPDIHLDAGEDLEICPGSSVLLHVDHAGKNIKWTPSTGLRCDTCVSTVASPAVTTTYIVRGIDSSGCSSIDTVEVKVRSLEVHYRLGAEDASDSLTTMIGSDFDLGLYAESEAWSKIVTNSVTATIRVDEHLLHSLDSIVRGPALPESWRIEVIDSLSDPLQGVLVVHAWGDSAITTSGRLFSVVYRSLLDTAFSLRPQLKVASTAVNTICSSNTSETAVIQLSGCAVSLRHVVLSPFTTTLYAPHPNPVSAMTLSFEYSLAFAAAVDIRLYATDGSLIHSESVTSASAGIHSQEIDLSAVSNGVYMLVLHCDNVLQRVPIVVHR